MLGFRIRSFYLQLRGLTLVLGACCGAELLDYAFRGRKPPGGSRRLETYPMQSAYLCNHAIREYEPSNFNPTVAVILHLNPPPHQQSSL